MGANSAIQLCSGESRDGIRRAVGIAGGQSALARKIGVAQGHVWDWLNKSPIPADHCPAVEQATGVACDDLRPDLVWVRDGANEVLGYLTPVDGADAAYVRQAISAQPPSSDLVSNQWDIPSYRAGILHGVDPDVASQLLASTYGEVTDWCREGVFDRLLADADQYRSDSSYHQAYGMLWDFDDDTRDQLLDECGVNLTRDWSVAKTNALWEKAQEIRFKHPEKSSIAAAVHALGMASVAETHQEIEYLVDQHAIRPGSTWTAETYDDLSENVRAVVLRSMLDIEKDGTPDWPDILLGQTYATRSLLFGKEAERMAQAAMNLLDCILPGISAVHDIQWVAMDSKDADGLDRSSVRDLAVFLRSMNELVHLLVLLRDNMLFRVRQLEG